MIWFILCAFLSYAVLAVAQVVPDESIKVQFEEFLHSNNRSYNSLEKERRYKIFRNSLKRIQQLNDKRQISSDAFYRVTNFADFTFDEISRFFTGSIESSRVASKFDDRIILPVVSQKINWADHNVVPEARDQGACASSYAFAAADLVAAQWAIDHKESRRYLLSTQVILDCITSVDTYGCNGGDAFSVLAIFTNCSQCLWPLENCYPYGRVARDKCAIEQRKCAEIDSPEIQVERSYEIDISSKREKEFLAALLQRGPFSAMVTVSDHWQHYGGGIMRAGQCEANSQLNHAVLITGYDFTGPIPFYYVKNSWGKNWGDNGYLKMEAGSNACGIAKRLVGVCTKNCGSGSGRESLQVGLGKSSKWFQSLNQKVLPAQQLKDFALALPILFDPAYLPADSSKPISAPPQPSSPNQPQLAPSAPASAPVSPAAQPPSQPAPQTPPQSVLPQPAPPSSQPAVQPPPVASYLVVPPALSTLPPSQYGPKPPNPIQPPYDVPRPSLPPPIVPPVQTLPPPQLPSIPTPNPQPPSATPQAPSPPTPFLIQTVQNPGGASSTPLGSTAPSIPATPCPSPQAAPPSISQVVVLVVPRERDQPLPQQPQPAAPPSQSVVVQPPQPIFPPQPIIQQSQQQTQQQIVPVLVVPPPPPPQPTRPPGEFSEEFESFLREFRKVYRDEEKRLRAQIFEKNKASIRALNGRRATPFDATYGYTPFADQTFDEFKKFVGAVEPLQSCEQFKQTVDTVTKVPNRFDWTDLGVVPPVRNQNPCGACYAFTAADLVSSQWAIDHGTSHQSELLLSTQVVLDCGKGGDDVCKGGQPFYVMGNISECGTPPNNPCPWPSEACYPYQGNLSSTVPTCTTEQRACVANASVQGLERVLPPFDLANSQEKEKVAALLLGGPFIAQVKLTDSWQLYTGNVILKASDVNNEEERLYHFVLITGYDFTGPIPFYIGKNSWGDAWGDRGFVYLEAGANTAELAHCLMSVCTKDCDKAKSPDEFLLARAAKTKNRRA